MKQPRAQRIVDSPGVTFRWQGRARRNRQLPRCRVPPAAVPKPLEGVHSRRPGLIESREGARTEPMAFCFTECTEDVEPRKAMSDLRFLSIWRPSLGATSVCVHSSRDNCRSQKPELGLALTHEVTGGNDAGMVELQSSAISTPCGSGIERNGGDRGEPSFVRERTDVMNV